MRDVYQKLRDLLDARERRNGVLVFCMMLFLGFLEAAGVTSIMPFISVLANPQIVDNNTYMAALHRFLGAPETNEFLFLLAVVVFAFAVGRVAFAAMTQYAMVRYYNMRNLSLSTRLLERYLRQPYAWFLNRHSADLGRVVLTEVDHVINGSLKPGLELVAHTIVTLCFVAVLVIVDPVIAGTALFVIGGAYGALYLGVQKYLDRIGRDRLFANRQRFQIAQDILGGIKEVKVSGIEAAYVQRFRGPASVFYRRKSASHIINQMPRFFFEAFTIGGMLIVVMVLLLRSDGDLSKVLPVLGIYAYTGMRLLPVLQQIYSSLTKIRFGRAALDTLHADLAGASDPVKAAGAGAATALTLRNSIALRNIGYTYPNAETPVLADLSLTIPAGTTVGFVGTTGAGKTTVVDLILGLLEPQRGELQVDGIAITPNNVRAWQRAVGYVPQHIFLSDDSVAGNIAFGVPPGKIDQRAVERAARFAQLHSFVTEELPQGYATAVGERGVRLSGGQRQRIGIARALYHDPQVLVLDEATSALDTLTERAIMAALHDLGDAKTIVLIAHRLSTVRDCNQIFVLKQGRVEAMGSYNELLATDTGFRDMAAAAA